MSIAIPERATISIILGVIFPGVGHIYFGEQKKGIKISIVFVVISYVTPRIMESFFGFGQIGYLFGFIPIVLIWIWQIFNLIKIIEVQQKT